MRRANRTCGITNNWRSSACLAYG